MLQRVCVSLVWSLILTGITVLLLQVAGAQVMSSPSYQLQSDSINVGGGLSSSTNFVQESTVGEVATGPSDSTTFSLRAGYQQMQEVFLSLSAPTNIVLAPELGGLTGGESNGSTTVTVITDSPSGYQITLQAENDPAMQAPSGDTIADYDAGGLPDYTFTVGATDARFGFTPTGVDIVANFAEGAGSTCGGGVSTESLVCWDGLTTSARTITEATSRTDIAGATTTIHFRVGIGGTAVVPAGVYTATTTLTAYPL